MNDASAADMNDLRVAITGGTSGLGLALVRELRPARRPRRLRRPHPRARRTRRSRSSGYPRHRRRHRAEGGHLPASPFRSVPHSADSTCSSTTPRAWGRRRSRSSATPSAKTSHSRSRPTSCGPFRLTKALLGALTASAREGRGAVVLNVSSDAAINAYAQWGAYGASKAALRHMSAIWGEELVAEGVRFLSLDPGDMDTPLHALAVPGADPGNAQATRDRGARARRCHLGCARQGARMIAARHPVQRAQRRTPARHRSGTARLRMPARSSLADFLEPGDLVIANDAGTLPASLHGVHLASGAPIEVRLAGRASFAREDLRFAAVVFGAGDWRTRTEDRPLPPPFALGDRLALGPLVAAVDGTLGHPRLVALKFEGRADRVWAGIAQHGAPDSVRVPRPSACPVGRVDADRRPPRRVRASFRRFRARLEIPPRAARSRRGVCDDHAGGRHLFDRRSRARCAPAARRALSHSCDHRIRHSPDTGRAAAASSPSGRRSFAHSSIPRAAAETAWPTSASARTRASPSSMQSFRGRTGPEESHYQMLRAFHGDDVLAAGRGWRWKPRTTARTSSATRC